MTAMMLYNSLTCASSNNLVKSCSTVVLQEANETDAMRRKREKLERKQNKVKYSKGRR